VVFEVGVYTDNEGGVAANRAAANRRAEVLKAWLVNAGIQAKQFVVKPYGPVNFVADNATEEGRDKNRRVEVKRLSGDIHRHPKPVIEPARPPPTPAPGRRRAGSDRDEPPAESGPPAGSRRRPQRRPRRPPRNPGRRPKRQAPRRCRAAGRSAARRRGDAPAEAEQKPP
jgi:hypothetical protein